MQQLVYAAGTEWTDKKSYWLEEGEDLEMVESRDCQQ